MCESRESHDPVRRIVTYSMRLLPGHRNDNRQTEPAQNEMDGPRALKAGHRDVIKNSPSPRGADFRGDRPSLKASFRLASADFCLCEYANRDTRY